MPLCPLVRQEGLEEYFLGAARGYRLRGGLPRQHHRVPISMRPVPAKKASRLSVVLGGGRVSTKIHACVEGLGQTGAVHNVAQAQALLETVVPAAVLADKAYDTNALLACIANKQAKAVIPPKTTRKLQRQFDRHQYRNRNVIERFFARIKQFRRVATRYDKLASRFASFVALTASLLWLQ